MKYIKSTKVFIFGNQPNIMGLRKEPNPNTAYGRKRIRESELLHKEVILLPEEEAKKTTLSKRKTAVPEKEPNYTVFKFLFLGVIIVYALWQTYGKTGEKRSEQSSNSYSTQSPSDIPDEGTAYQIAQTFVKEEIVSPTSSEFRSSASVYVGNPIDSTYKILSYLDADNSYGAHIRQTFTIHLKYKGGDEYNMQNWEKLSLTFNGN